jgi:ATP-dependent helicase HrpA
LYDSAQFMSREIRFDPALPVSARRAEIRAALEQHQAIVVCGETGSGKTTQLPKILLEMGAAGAASASATPSRAASPRAASRRASPRSSAPSSAGWSDTRCASRTGARRHRDQADDRRHPAGRDAGRPLLSQYDTIIVDEAHERSLNIDFLLGYLKSCSRGAAI